MADIDVQARVQWLGAASMKVEVKIQNNEAAEYKGTLKAFVTEIVSSMGWIDASNSPYNFTFLDYAFNEPVSIPPKGTWQKFVIWDGNLHNDGFGKTFGGITYDNIQVTAAVYNEKWHQGYSDPPAGKPFDAYYVDEADAARPDALTADSNALPEAGGVINFNLYAGIDQASRGYLLLGSVTGTEPGTPLPGNLAVLPLNWDGLTNAIIYLLNGPVFVNFCGLLDSNGMGTAQLNAPPTSGLLGTILHFAYVLDNPYDFASNAVKVEITP